MNLGEVIVYLVIALLCGVGGQMLAGRSIGGYVVATVVGVIGAVLGAFLARSIGAPEPFPVTVGGERLPILWAIIGAALVTLVIAYVQRGRKGSSS